MYHMSFINRLGSRNISMGLQTMNAINKKAPSPTSTAANLGRFMKINREHIYHNVKRWSSYHFNYGPSPKPQILKLRPTIFSLLFCGSVFTGAALYSNSNDDSKGSNTSGPQSSLQKLKNWLSQESRETSRTLTSDARKVIPYGYRMRSIEHQRCVYRIASWPSWVPDEVKKVFIMGADGWYTLTTGERIVYGIVGVNLAVFGLWQIPRMIPFMARHFMHDPLSGRSYTLLTSMFSHNELWHLGFNMIALVSFSKAVSSFMGPEQFTAFYLSSGVLSALASHLGSSMLCTAILPSLGASGAIYSLLAATAFTYPTSKIMLIFLPFIPISIGHAFPALLAYDLLGVLLKWQRFDHLGHLGGALSGLAYMQWGTDAVWKQLNSIIQNSSISK